MKIVFAFLILFSATLNASNYSINGKLLDAQQKTPIAGATITIVDIGKILASKTDGSFSVENLKEGKYTFRFSSVGYNSLETRILIPTDSIINIQMEPSVEDLETVVVTGTRSEKRLKDAPVLTQVIHPERLRASGITTVSAALQHEVPGVEFANFNSRPKITFQGMNAKYLLFLVDGERIAGEMDGDIDYYRLNLDNVERIEVVRGASSALYGSNAIGGVINIITKKAKLPFELNSHIRYSHYNELAAGTAIGTTKDKLSSQSSVSYNQSDGYDINPDPSIKSQDKFKNAAFNQRFDYGISQKVNFIAKAGVFYSHVYDRTVIPIDHGYVGLNGYIKAQYNPHDSLHFELCYAADDYSNYNIQILNDNKFKQTAFDFQQNVRFLAKKSSQIGIFLAGVEYKPEKIKSNRIIDEVRTSSELIGYVQHDLSFYKYFGIVTGFRAAKHSIYGSNFTPKVSLMAKFDPIALRFSYGKGFRSPTLKEMYYSFDHLGMFKIFGNENLKPEKSDYFGFSVELNQKKLNTSANFYYNEVNDMIFDSMMVSGDYQYSNIARAVVKGIDFMGRYQINRNINTGIGLSYVDALDKTYNRRMYNISPLSINGHVNYNFQVINQKANIELFGKFTEGREFKPTLGHTYIDEPFQSWRFTYTQRYKERLIVAIGVDNIFDQTDPGSLGNTSPGRRYFVSVNYNFTKY